MNSEYDTAAYIKGFEECLWSKGNNNRSINPYPKETKEWRSWNRGWNTALDHLES